MGTEIIRTSKNAKRILAAKAKVTGRSISELTEYAVMNMPYIPVKKLKKKDE
jgi:hypothetical protein